MFLNVPEGRFMIQVAGVVAFAVTLYTLWSDIEERKSNSISAAWQTIASAKERNVRNIGAASAMQVLASNNIRMTDIGLSGAYLRRLMLDGAIMGRANFGTQCISPRLRDPDLFSANDEWRQSVCGLDEFKDAMFTEEQCENIKPTDLQESKIINSILGHSNFFGASMRGVNFEGSCLYAAEFVGADVSDTNFTDTILRDAKFTGSLLGDTLFRGADVNGADFRFTVCRKEKERETVYEPCRRDRFTVCRKEKTREIVYELCRRDDIESLLSEVKSSCGIKYPTDGHKYAEGEVTDECGEEEIKFNC